ncbi:endolytic transglycosylase MltG [Streptomyces sp. NBC_01190]|uniref:endolytic transglycosylase MltG n=1 Tax=Streptomyces sp. NBC_01190 TaxID=2903767 RepID=UPI00386D0DCE|nr:endolytic transglycosylase MltG [Streptomyces sp. NBC_01190]
MTDYGRGSGSEPWHPEDPLFGDAYDQGHGYQQPAQQPEQQQQQHQQQDGGWQDPYASGQQPQYPQDGYPQQQYPYPQQPEDQHYPQGQQPQHPQHPQQYAQQPQHPQQGYPRQGGYDPYDTGSHQTGGYGHQDPYGGQQQDPYGRPDFYGQNGYPQQQPQYPQQPQQPGLHPGQQMPGAGQPQQGQPHHGEPAQAQPQMFGQPGQPGQQPGQPGRPLRQPGPQQPERPREPAADPLRTAPDTTGSWDTEQEDDPHDHAFFSGHDAEDEHGDPSTPAVGGRRAGKSQPKGGKKRRSGCACAVVMVVLVGGLSGVGYFGYSFYESHFGPAPDYSGLGTTDVQVQIPTGSTATTMGNILKQAGVVKSVDAFVTAANKNSKSRSIQAGVYVLKTQMSASAAITMMLDPKSQSGLIIPEGWRDQQIYQAIDARLDLAKGSTYKIAKAQAKSLGLPAWADTSPEIKDPLEGFLFPSRYSIAKGMKPEDLLKQMVGEAKEQYAQFDMAAEAQKQGLKTPLQLLTVASLVQAEGKTVDDYRKMAAVVYHRMDVSNQETHGLLQFDSTYNYIKSASNTKIALKDIHSLDDPYNTYVDRGLPPGPIGNPGLTALKAAMNPDPGNWWYFISLDNKTTRFTETKSEFDKLYQQYNSQ